MTAVLLTGAAVATTGAASAAETTAGERVQAACLDTAFLYEATSGSGSGNAHWPGTGYWATTTSNCEDINIKTNTTRSVRTCFKATGSCNAWRTAPAGQWALAATDVNDGSQFYIQFSGTAGGRGYIAY
ncbi:hypothetical protein AB0L67_38710 [Streptomyces flaveolus]|uniref:hypothetical protein n=1 Tax=Streptomyces flaveolus TaxID=67297 RepID=UPI00342F826C